MDQDEFPAAQHNFVQAAQHGIDARLYWPGLGEVTADELVLRQLLPMADEGLRRWEVAAEVRDRYLGVIEGRAKTGRNGATWQVSTVRALQERVWRGPPRSRRCCAGTGRGCTATNPCTPGMRFRGPGGLNLLGRGRQRFGELPEVFWRRIDVWRRPQHRRRHLERSAQHFGVVVTMPRSAISQARTFWGRRLPSAPAW